MLRIGQGIDVHAFAENRELILGGVKIPHTKGLAGHSDADVLIHALMDALLGALALGDIGKLFPDNDMKFKDADSMKLLAEVLSLKEFENVRLVNADITVVAQKPKIAPYTELMRQNIADTMNCSISQISVKGTTTEKLGFCGREEGVLATAAVLLEVDND
ncbi:MAG: 2-C-methyl-D-erythritol 2,4-cyclodiphosphate synthase [Lentisphaeria bacterium]|nr:2-C-methyl-D-erythritol 2,4-cyclodiphosphate synthase [Lentisphaeria bacterium]